MDTKEIMTLYMTPLDDHEFLKVCAQLATCQSISIAAARRQVELLASKEGVRDISARKEIAKRLLRMAKTIESSDDDLRKAAQFDLLLEALKEDENFMLED